MRDYNGQRLMPIKERLNPDKSKNMLTFEINIKIWKVKIAKIILTIF